MHDRLDISNILVAVVFTALGVIVPVLFHLLGLGAMFLPMYLPLAMGAFLLDRRNALMAGAVTPLASAVLTGMPPFYPPIAVMMALQLGAMCLFISWVSHRFQHRLGSISRLHILGILAAALLLDRVLMLVMYGGILPMLGMRTGLFVLYDLARGLPGMALILLAVPPAVPGALGLLRKHSLRPREYQDTVEHGHRGVAER